MSAFWQREALHFEHTVPCSDPSFMAAFAHVPSGLSVSTAFRAGGCFVLRLVPCWAEGQYFWEELSLDGPSLGPLASRVSAGPPQRPSPAVDLVLLGEFFARLRACLSPGFLLSLRVMSS